MSDHMFDEWDCDSLAIAFEEGIYGFERPIIMGDDQFNSDHPEYVSYMYELEKYRVSVVNATFILYIKFGITTFTPEGKVELDTEKFVELKKQGKIKVDKDCGPYFVLPKQVRK